MNLSEALAMVEVTSSQAITLLNGLAEGVTDKDHGLSVAINDAIALLASGETPAAPPEEETKSEY